MRVFLVTPLRNEMANIPIFLEAISRQLHMPHGLVIVENDSFDGSKEALETTDWPAGIDAVHVMNISLPNKDYALGEKYATIVNTGFEYILENTDFGDDDLIGIVDADSFPEADYYKLIVEHFQANAKLGITSGLSRDHHGGNESRHSRSWVRGSCRLWRGSCFRQCGYVIGPSADVLSAAKAQLDGWDVEITPGARFSSRVVGDRVSHRYYGRSTYFRGHSMTYALLRSLKYFSRREYKYGFEYLQGYFSDLASNAPRIEDERIRQHFKSALTRKLKKVLSRRQAPIWPARRP